MSQSQRLLGKTVPKTGHDPYTRRAHQDAKGRFGVVKALRGEAG